MRNQTLSTEFGVSIFPKVQDDNFGIKLRPQFLQPSSLTTNLTIGMSWNYQLPETKHELPDVLVFYYKVELGPAAPFLKFSKENLVLQIDEGVTTEAQIGQYEIELQLIDEMGVLSKKLTLTLNLLQIGTDAGSVEENEQSEDSETVSTFDPKLGAVQNIGSLFASMLVRRAQLGNKLESSEEVPPLPSASIQSIDRLGKISVQFSNPMEVIPELISLGSRISQ